ncbi:MAG: oligosaccharide flippase family protein [Flammeovirgaceae bacterium]|jgi:O-antigen/teichoic acid export membrane protein|nr:oligosaccharide flippase family protein [Flammeovirgaceae bacterium]|tara:strand:+ start:14114 stop:15598 length:1485 start_codon:yes stop_codon:yes gene_type:complete
MGIVIRQSALSATTSYLGVIVGFVNAIVLMPKFLTPDEIGLFRTLLGAALLLSTFGKFGISAALIRFKSLLEQKNIDAKAVYGLGLFINICTTLLFLVLFFIFRDFFERFYDAKADAIHDYFWLLVILTIELISFAFLQSLASIHMSIFVANTLKDLIYKILNMAGIVLLGMGWISFNTFVHSHLLLYLILMVILYVESVVKFKIKISFNLLPTAVIKEFIRYCSVIFLSGLGMSLLTLADQQLVSSYLGLSANAIYTTAIFMVMIIELPYRFVSEISAPILSNAFAKKDFNEINNHYKKASINLFLIGSLLYLLLVINLDNIFQLMPSGQFYAAGKSVVLIAGFTKLINMLFSINDSIIAISKYYKFNMALILILGIAMIGADMLLIPEFGLLGAAYAYFAVFTVYNILKMLLLKITSNLFPFTKKTIFAMALMATLYMLNFSFPFFINPWLDILMRSLILVLIFTFSIYKLKLSVEINEILEKVFFRLTSRK